MVADVASSRSGNGAATEPTLMQASTTWRLPVELLLQCLIASDMGTRIRASHVCHAWREVALAERRLWDSFSFSDFRNKQHEDAMFSRLQTVLLRSRPLPFHLTVPHSHAGLYFMYKKRLLDLEAFDIRRLAAYHGPAIIFEQLNPSGHPLPAFVCLDVLEPDDGEPYGAAITMEGPLGSHCLPNLQQLIAPSARFPTDCAPFLALKSIAFACMQGIHHRTLFTHCPHLVWLDIGDSLMGTPLPDPPVPPSLEEVSIRCTRPRALDFAALMRHWSGVPVRRVIASEVYSLQGVLPLFLASHAQPIELRLVGENEEVALAAIPDDDSIWTLSPSPPWAADFLRSIETPTSDRLTSMCVSFSRLGALLRAQLHTLGLEQLEIRLDGNADADATPLHCSDEYFLRAPRLRSVFFNFGDDSPDSLDDALAVLRTSFRSLIRYDAELLDFVTVSRHAEQVCSAFALFTKEYVLCVG